MNTQLVDGVVHPNQEFEQETTHIRSLRGLHDPELGDSMWYIVCLHVT